LLALLLVSGEIPLDFQFFRAEEVLEMDFADFVLVDKALELGSEPINLVSGLIYPRVKLVDPHFVVFNVISTAVSKVVLFFHAVFNFINGAFEFFRELLPFLLFILGELLTLVLEITE
jgi:hypothetical protein